MTTSPPTSDRIGPAPESRLLLAAAHAAANGILITDRDGTIEWVNPAFCSMTGFAPEESIGKNPRDLVKSGAHEPEFFRDMWETILGGAVWRGEMFNRKKDGSEYVELQTITPVLDDAGEITHFVAVKYDVTAEREAESQFLAAQRMESFGRLAAGVAHDFNNLLTVVNGVADLALRELDPEHALHADLTEILTAGNRGAALTRQLLAVGSRQPMSVARLDLTSVVRGMSEMLDRLIGDDVELRVRLAHDLPAILADMTKLEQVLLNLVVNARDAMPSGGKLTIETRAARLGPEFAATHVDVDPGEYVLLLVSDTGVGIAQDVQEQIFEPFFTTKGEKGTGLGLSTVYGIVKQSGGHVWVYSESGHGTTFKVYLPKAEGAVVTAEPVVSVPFRRTERRVLLVDDDDHVRSVVERMLERLGCHVQTASRAEDVDLKADWDIDVLLTDMIMPGMSGRELAKGLRARQPDLQVVFASGYAEGEALATDAVLPYRYLEKPFTAEELEQALLPILSSQHRA